jgi:hypothetical protein
MAIYWGVDSATSSTDLIDGRTLFDIVIEAAGQPPAFWGRYIGELFALTPEEVDFLHANGCKILVIYNGATNTLASVQGGFHEGVNDANQAIGAARTLGVPSGVWIYADLEASWSPTSEWFQGWSDTMMASEYGGAGGVYTNCLPAHAANFNTPYCAAFNHDSNMQGMGPAAALVFSSEPEPGCTSAASAPEFAPAGSPCNPNTVIWQYAENCLGGLFDEDLANDIGFASMW